jgi:hypothetical protein
MTAFRTHFLRLCPALVAALFVAMPAPAAPQGISQDTKAIPETVTPQQISVLTGGVFRVGEERLMISGMRAPRVARAQCFYEKRRGRASQRALKRLLSRGPIEIFRTGASSVSGIPLVRVVAAGQDVRARMIATGYGRPRGTARSNPWCVRP